MVLIKSTANNPKPLTLPTFIIPISLAVIGSLLRSPQIGSSLYIPPEIRFRSFLSNGGAIGGPLSASGKTFDLGQFRASDKSENSVLLRNSVKGAMVCDTNVVAAFAAWLKGRHVVDCRNPID